MMRNVVDSRPIDERAPLVPEPEADGSAMKRDFPWLRELIGWRSRPIRVSGDGSGRHRVVVVGGGFGGLPACRYLSRLHMDVTLIDRRNHHLFQPLLYQVATGILSPGQIATPLRHTLGGNPNVRVVQAEVVGFDLERQVVRAERPFGDAFDVPYDSLIVSAGVDQSYFGHDEFSLFAPGMKTIDDALEVRRRIFGAFEMAETAANDEERREWLTVAIVGAGPTGVEIAGQVRELALRSLTDEFRNFDPASVRVVLLDAGKEPLATFGNDLSASAARALERLGVEIRMNARVTNIGLPGVEVTTESGTELIAAHTVIWAAGVQASPLAGMLASAAGADVDRAGRIAVNPDLTLPGHPEVFAVGDMTTLNHLPGVAEVAMQGGLHAARTIARHVDGDDRSLPFKYHDLGSVATIGRFNAVCSVGRVRLSGFPAWVVWLFVHLAFLNGIGNRLSTMMRWLRWTFGSSRVERVFSVARTGGDVSTPDAVRRQFQPERFPALRHEEGESPS
jgi:NADH dehydrogenase